MTSARSKSESAPTSHFGASNGPRSCVTAWGPTLASMSCIGERSGRTETQLSRTAADTLGERLREHGQIDSPRAGRAHQGSGHAAGGGAADHRHGGRSDYVLGRYRT